VNAAAAAAAFGLTGPCEPLAGGEGTSVRCGDSVLKPAPEAHEARFVQETLASLDAAGVGAARLRIPAVRRAPDGRTVVDGWTATEFVAGLQELRPDWAAVVEAGRRFHTLLVPIPGSPALADRTHRWAVADRVAWDEQQVRLTPDAARVDATLRGWCRATPEPSQLVHADLTGNVLVDPDGTPVIIDFSPYVRPRTFATAVVVVDALLWNGAPLDVIDLLGPDPRPTLARALRFRLVAEQLATAPRHGAVVDHYEDLLSRL